jgi:rhodanese-related sulfurtransferase
VNRIRNVLVVGAAVLAVASCGSADPVITAVKPGKGAAMMAEMGDSLTVIDVRTGDEFAAGHIEGAVNIDVEAGDFTERIAALDPGAAYMVYCRSGRRSAIAASAMKDAGFTRLYDLGGVEDWTALGLPLVSG